MPATHVIRTVLAVSSWLLMSPSMAQPAAQAPWMTGERLLQLVTFRPGVKNNFDLTPAEFVDAERARAYIEGVHDLSEGKSWCYSQRYQPGPDALLDNVYTDLRSLSPAQLKRNAAELIVEIWQRRWPCQPGRTQR